MKQRLVKPAMAEWPRASAQLKWRCTASGPFSPAGSRVPGIISTHLGTCVDNNMGIMARFAEEESFFLAHVAPSRADPLEARQVIAVPDRD